MKHSILFDYENLIDKIVKYYNENTYNKNLYRLSKEAHINIYRLKGILDNRHYFLNSEIYSIIKILDIKESEIIKTFFNLKISEEDKNESK